MNMHAVYQIRYNDRMGVRNEKVGSRSRAVNVRLKEQDYLGLKTKAAELGMPYQSLLNSIIHRFLIGELKRA